MTRLKALLFFPFRRRFWTFMGLCLLLYGILAFGDLVEIGGWAPLGAEIVRWLLAIGIFLALLIWVLLREYRKLKAEGAFRKTLAPPEPEPSDPVAESVGLINEKFRRALDTLHASKRNTARTYLKTVPWYVFIGPPGTGKTTALKQAGLVSLVETEDDLKGHGGTRNCDWFFTENAVMIDTAGRLVEQRSDPGLDAGEWLGFLDILKKHRGRRALNGVIVAVSVQELLGDEMALTNHARDIRNRLDEIQARLGVVLPVYLMITKLDLVPGFNTYFGDRVLDEERRQVWGATFPEGVRMDGTGIAAELRTLFTRIDAGVPGMLGAETDPARRARVFRFPGQLETLVRPIRMLAERIGAAGEGEAAWLRGIYLTSATQEGTPITRMVSAMAAEFGLPAPAHATAPVREKRSFFLHDLMARVIFPEAGLATQDAASIRRSKAIFAGVAGVSVTATVVLALLFAINYASWSRTLTAQSEAFAQVTPRLSAGILPEVVSDAAPDFGVALAAVTDVANAAVDKNPTAIGALGPSAAGDLSRIQSANYDRVLTNALEPRMVALLEQTMWERLQDPRFQLGALKVYKFLTRTGSHGPEEAANWWFSELSKVTPVVLDPTPEARAHQERVFANLPRNRTAVTPNAPLVALSEEVICNNLSLAELALDEVLALPEVTAMPDWIPRANAAGRADEVFSRFSNRTLREGTDGAFTRDAFRQAILPNLDAVVERYTAESTFFLASCADSAARSEDTLRAEVLELYYQRFISEWDLLLTDLRLIPLPSDDIGQAITVLENVSSANGAFVTMLNGIAYQTDLAATDGGGRVVPAKARKTVMKTVCKIAKFACKAGKAAAKNGGGSASAAEAPVGDGMRVSLYYRPIRGIIEEVDAEAPKIDEVVTAMLELKGQLQTARNSGDPRRALDEMGGLSLLTGALVASANKLPDPISTWVVGIADDVNDLALEAVLARVNDRWQENYLGTCRLFTEGRFPFDTGARDDTTIQDFATLLGPDGIMDSFTKNEIANYIDDRTWTWRPGITRDPAPLDALRKAREIRNALWSGGAGPGPIMRFSLQPVDMSPNAASMTLSIDGEPLIYRHAFIEPKPFTWPGLNRSDVVSVAFTSLDGFQQEDETLTGDWSFLRLLRGGLTPTTRQLVYRLRLSTPSHWAILELRAQSLINPFDLTVFDGFACPDAF
ncbi:MAG: type VI secretion system membrane subunit TssM [Paracoccaceae bacterium]|nr:type VI secretion system membrane subunit TssM [Paracoccaceae bacterium]